MQSAETVLAEKEARTGENGAARVEKRAKVETARKCHDVVTPPRKLPVNPAADKTKWKRHETLRRGGEESGSSTRSARRNGAVSENIIGRRTPFGCKGFGRGNGLFDEDSAFALIHEPAREHGGSVFLEVLSEEGSQFLAEIGGRCEARKFVGLQGVAGSSE